MKCLKNVLTNKMIRVKDERARQLINGSNRYVHISKSEYKSVHGTAEQKAKIGSK